MKGILKHIIYLLLLSFAVEISAQTPIGILNSTTEELYSVFDKKESPGCAIAIIKNGEKVYQNCFGLSNIECKTPITDSTEFFIASVSKQFTGYAVSKLILDGKLDYNSHLSFYLPNQNSLWDSVKIKHLIHQVSGIWDWPYLFLATGHTFDDVLNSDGILKLIKSQSQLSFPTQSKFQYTSSNYMLLGEVVKSLVKEDYYEWMQKNVLYSANMMNTRFQRSNTEMIANRASGYLFKNGNYCRTTNNFSPIGTGFIYSTIEDMSNWMNYLLKEQDLPIVSQMFETSMLVNDKEIPYAFGLMKREKNTFWHDGFLQGFRVITILNPKENFALVLLSNSGSNYIVRSAFTVANMYLSDSIPEAEIKKYKQRLINEPQRKRKPETELKYTQSLIAFKGIYLNKDLLVTYRIYEENDSLFAENSIERIFLKPIGSQQDCFGSDKFMLGDFIFKRNLNQEIEELWIKQKRDNIIKFKRIE